MKATFYKKNANGSMQEWSIEHNNDELIINYGVIGGAIQEQTEQIETNNSGRSLEEQAILRFRSRINKQLDKGYCTSIEEAEQCDGLNALKLLRPMLAKKVKDVRNVKYDGAWLQYKYNGYRMLVTCIGGQNIAYSRNGKLIVTVPHILDDLKIPEGHTVDGELYCHGIKLQQIGSWVRRAQDSTKKLSYILYDTITNDSYRRRRESLFNYSDGPSVHVAPSQIISSESVIKPRMEDAIAKGYEGLILRQDNFGYFAGKRHASLIKIKQCHDDEFIVVDVLASADGWGILVCLLDGGEKEFRVSAPGPIMNKEYILNNKLKYIGKLINVEYFELTDDGVPFHPVAIDWRERE